MIGSILFLSRFKSNLKIHMASHEAVVAAIYYASVELSAMDFYFLMHQEVIPDPRLKQYPLVLFRSTVLLAQSALVNPLN